MKSILIIISLSLLTSPTFAKRVSIQDRLAILEQKINEQQVNNSSNADIIMQNQQLQQQIAELKGTIEQQDHQIENLKNKQKLLYVDIDSRLAELESRPQSTQSINQATTQPSNIAQRPTVEVETNYQAPMTTTTINEPTLSSDQDTYDIAFAHLRAGRFLESARAFENFIQNYPENELTDDAYYWLGESYYVKRQYPQALAAFKSLSVKYPNSKKIADTWLKIGYSYYEMDDLEQAEKVLNQVVNNYPSSSVARLAKNRLLQLQRDH